jgi:hypothetical protein
MTKARDLANIGSMASGGISFRNRLINGNAIIGQRGVVNVTTTTPAYGTDRFLAGVVSGTGINVNLFKSAFGGSSSGLAHYITGSMTNGVPYWCQRMEAQNGIDLSGKNVTVSGLLYQDTGSTQQFVPRLSKANAVDNFGGGITAIQTGSAISVPSGVVVPFSAVFTLGSTDAANGLMVEVYSANPITCTSKNFCITDLQLEKGAIIAPTFENRFVGLELALCQRYYQRLHVSARGYSMGAAYAVTCAASWAPMRALPTWSRVSGPSAQANVYAPNPYGQLIADSVNSGYYNLSAAGTGDVYAVSVLFESTGTEL